MEIFSIRAIFFALLPGSENSRPTDFVLAQNGDYFALPHLPIYARPTYAPPHLRSYALPVIDNS
jgi:hypothetical protein